MKTKAFLYNAAMGPTARRRTNAVKPKKVKRKVKRND